MVFLREKRKLKNLNKENCKEHPRSNLVQMSNVPNSLVVYFTQLSEEIEGILTTKLTPEYSKTESGISGAVSLLGGFFRTH